MPARKTKKSLTIGDLGAKLMQLKTSQVLYVALLVLVFVLGYLVARVQLLEKGSAAGGNETPQAGQQPEPALSQEEVLKKLTNGRFPVKGNKDAKVKIVEFADFRCPFCERYYTDTLSQIVKNYTDSGKVAYYFRNYAFLGPASDIAAHTVECANEQGKFWEMHDWLYENQPPETDTSLYTIEGMTEAAGTVGLDTAKFNSCMTSNKFKDNVAKDLSDGQAVGVSGTPTFYINGRQLVGAQPYDSFKQIIEEELKK